VRSATNQSNRKPGFYVFEFFYFYLRQVM